MYNNPLNLPLSLPGSDFTLEEIYDGVLGYAMMDIRGLILIPYIKAKHESSGDVGRFLDQLKYGRYAIPNVTSGKLQGMLIRRGWQRVMEICAEPGPFQGESIDVWYPPRET